MGEGIQMNGLLDYQQGSVVSRTIIKNPAGTVALFAFDQGEGLSEHTALFDAMVHIVDGAAKITVSGKPYNLKGRRRDRHAPKRAPCASRQREV